MRILRCAAFAPVALMIGVVMVGCSDTLTVAPASGTVVYQGKPVAGATVVFQSEGGPPAIATTDEQGRFSMNTQGRDGVLPGKAKVTISLVEATEVGNPNAVMDGDIPSDDPAAFEASLTSADLAAMARARSLIPQKYNHFQTSGLTADVVVGQDNEFHFELVD